MNEFRVGLMALATIVAVVYMSLKITSNQSGFGEYIQYRTIISDASGIFPKTPIKVAGINAGRITQIELQKNTALINFEVLKKVLIPKDSKLTIKTVGFLGDKYIEIIIGDSQERLSEGEFIASEFGGGMEALVRDASEVMQDVKEIVKSLKKTIAPENQEAPLTRILSDFKEISENTKEVTASLKRIMGNNEQKINNLLANLETVSKELAYHLNKDEKESTISDIKGVLAKTDKMMADLQAIVADLKAGKGTMGKLLVEEEIADEVKETLSGVQKIVNRVNDIRSEISVFTGANTDQGGQSDFNLKIFPGPERFLLLGLSTSEFGPFTEEHTSRTINGVESTEVIKQRDKNTFRFNAQVGRTIHDITFRGGLIESSGGIGVDYDVNQWGSRFTIDAYDYRENIGMNFRFRTQIQIWNALYTQLDFEDMAEDSRSATISAGLRFNDEDLKSLIGLFFN